MHHHVAAEPDFKRRLLGSPQMPHESISPTTVDMEIDVPIPTTTTTTNEWTRFNYKRAEPDFRSSRAASPVSQFVHDLRQSLPRSSSTSWLTTLSSSPPPLESLQDDKRLRQTPFVSVKTLSGTTIRIDFPDISKDCISVQEVRRLLWECHGVDPTQTRLLFNRQIVSNFFDLMLCCGTTVHLVASFTGANGLDGTIDSTTCTKSWEPF